jgi:ubiquinol-cytochrome c reductase cytochrome c subunit
VRVRLATIVWAIGVVGCVGLITEVARPDPSRAALDPIRRGRLSASDVEHVFLRDCATCHGADTRGTDLGPDLRGVGTAGIDYQVSTGRMPLSSPDAEPTRSTPRYSPATIRALVAYVHALAGGGPAIPDVDVAAGDLQQGGSIFRLNCAACHAWSGDGGALLNRAAPAVHPATDEQIAEAIRTGPGNMPAFGTAAITHDQLNSVIRYVQHLDHPDDRGGLALGHLGPLAEGAVAIVLALGLLVLAVRWIGTRT